MLRTYAMLLVSTATVNCRLPSEHYSSVDSGLIGSVAVTVFWLNFRLGVRRRRRLHNATKTRQVYEGQRNYVLNIVKQLHISGDTSLASLYG